MSSRSSAVAALVAGATGLLLLAFAPPVAAPAPTPSTSTSADPVVDPMRVFPDPLIAGDFIQFTADPITGSSQYLDGITELAARYPDVIAVNDVCELACDDLTADELDRLETQGFLVRDGDGLPAAVTSAGGRALPVVTVTDHEWDGVPVDERIDLYVSMSIHGGERAGLEGSLRAIEDFAIHFTEERAGVAEHLLRNGDPSRPFYREITTTDALRAARIVFVDLNPDGWAAGDRFGGGGVFSRGNDAGIDLNRQWSTLGWHNTGGAQYDTFSQPESIMGRALIEGELGRPEGGADLHGELTDNVLLAIMFPAGEFDPLQLAAQVELAEAIKYNVNHSVFPGVNGALTDVIDGPVYPAEYHTAYDAIGYDDSGFQGDYLVQQGILEMDHEYILSNAVPSSVFLPALEQVHVDTTRALLEATIVTTIVAYTDTGITYEADLGGSRVAYVHNPEVLTEAGALEFPAFDLEQKPYSVTTMKYFEDLAPLVDDGSVLLPVTADQVLAGGLEGFDRVVVSDRAVPTFVGADGNIVEVDGDAFWSVVAEFAFAGGDVILTDASVVGLEAMGVIAADSVERITQYAGEIQGVDRTHPLLTDVGGIVAQTYFEVPNGYPVGDAAPAWIVDSLAWQDAGGTVAATAGASGGLETIQQGLTGIDLGDDPQATGGGVALGTLPVGAGRVTIFGAILPRQSQEHAHTHGLANYAVTYAGNAILVNALAAR